MIAQYHSATSRLHIVHNKYTLHVNNIACGTEEFDRCILPIINPIAYEQDVPIHKYGIVHFP